MSFAACFFGAMNKALWMGLSVSVTACVVAVLLTSYRRRVDFFKITFIIIMGCTFEVINGRLGLYNYDIQGRWPPVWLFSFWPTFSILFIDVLKFLYTKPFVLRYFVGFLGGMVYWNGEWLGLLSFKHDKVVMMFVFALTWAIEFIILLYSARVIDHNFAPSTARPQP